MLADGREVKGTKYASGLTDAHVPDIRGMFLRGIDPSGKADPDGARSSGSIQIFATSLPTASFSGVTSDDGGYSLHDYPGYSGAGDRFNAGGSDYVVVGIAPSEPLPAHRHSVTISEGGDVETRPSNVAVYYYIKIN